MVCPQHHYSLNVRHDLYIFKPLFLFSFPGLQIHDTCNQADLTRRHLYHVITVATRDHFDDIGAPLSGPFSSPASTVYSFSSNSATTEGLGSNTSAEALTKMQLEDKGDSSNFSKSGSIRLGGQRRSGGLRGPPPLLGNKLKRNHSYYYFMWK